MPLSWEKDNINSWNQKRSADQPGRGLNYSSSCMSVSDDLMVCDLLSGACWNRILQGSFFMSLWNHDALWKWYLCLPYLWGYFPAGTYIWRWKISIKPKWQCELYDLVSCLLSLAIFVRVVLCWPYYLVWVPDVTQTVLCSKCIRQLSCVFQAF